MSQPPPANPSFVARRLATVKATLALLRIRSFDTTTAQGRSQERLRRIALTAATSAFSKAVSMLAPLITVPLTLNYLGKESYGLWMTVTSMVGMFTFADLGLGNGLLTSVSNAFGKNDELKMRRCISSTLFVLLLVAVILAALVVLIAPFVPWGRFLNIAQPQLLEQSKTVVIICLVGLAANLPLGVVQRTQLGLQEGFQSNLWQCGASLLNLAIIITAVKMKASLAVLVLCVTAVQPIIAMANGLVFFGCQRRDLFPHLRDFHWQTAQHLLRQGFYFFLLSLIMALGIHSDNIVVANLLGLDAVALLSVPARVAVILTTVVSMIYMPLWTANGEAFARGDFDWVKRNTYRIVKLNLAMVSFAGLGFVLLGPPVLHLWIGNHFTPGTSVFAALASWALLVSTAGPLFMVLNAKGMIKVQVKIFAIFTIVSILLKMILTQHIGVAGAVWASVVSYALLVLPATWLLVAKVFAQPASPPSPTGARDPVAFKH